MNPSVQLWKFVRGDLSTADFETWLYEQDGLEDFLGSKLYFVVISADYKNPDDRFDVREKLKAALRAPLKCECITLPDIAVVPMGGDGLDKRFFATVEEVQLHGRDLWWLHLSRCRVCGQNWMIAQEERIYDDYFLTRLSLDQACNIVDRDNWPNDFSTYEKVLRIGRNNSKACKFLDPLSWSLVDTAHDLRASRPDITTVEIADLLGIDAEHVGALLAVDR